MDYTGYLQQTIDYIEENLHKEISIEECAQTAGFSKYHFHRLFGLFVGVPLMEYIRKRRLYHAMDDVLDGKRILDIALEYGYSSERAFSRAFQQEFGQIPSRCRDSKYSMPQKPNLGVIFNSLQGGFAMDYFSDVTIKNLEFMKVASAHRISSQPEDEVISYMTEWAEKAGPWPNSRKFGFDVPVTEEEQSSGLRGYEYWVTLEVGSIQLPDDIVKKDVEGCKYAVLRITDPFADPFERIPVGWKKLAGWVNDRGYKTSCDKERYWLEEVLELDSQVVMDIYFPIE